MGVWGRTARLAGCAAVLGALPALAPPPLAGPHASAQQAPDIACARPARVDAPSTPEWAVELRRFATGAGVRVAVIDTGIAPSPEFSRLVPGTDFVSADAPDPFFDCDGHGTVVAGIIAGRTAGIAPDAELISIRQTSAHVRAAAGETDSDPAGAGNLETLTDAVNNALDLGAGVINISVVSCVDPRLAPGVDSSGLDAALARAEDAGAVVVAAAGNVTASCPEGSSVFPAHAPTVLAVGSRADAYSMADYSLQPPDGAAALSAPGFVAAAPSPDGNGWAGGTLGRQDEVVAFEGTSFAAPVVTGTVAALRQRRPELTPSQIRAVIHAAAEPSGGAIDPLSVVTHVPSASPGPAQPLSISAVRSPASSAPQRWHVLASAAAAVLVSATVGASVLRSPAARGRG